MYGTPTGGHVAIMCSRQIERSQSWETALECMSQTVFCYFAVKLAAVWQIDIIVTNLDI